MSKIRYYMNNTCEVIREISEDFSEVKIYPEYAGDLEGSQWCTACLAAPAGCHPSHQCDEYQDVIDAIRDSGASMIIVVENRLLEDRPVEFKAFQAMRDAIDEMKCKQKQLREEKILLQADVKRLSEYKVSLQEDIYHAELERDDINTKTCEEGSRLKSIVITTDNVEGRLNALRGIVTISVSEYADLIRSQVTLAALKTGGVDDWEWYEESLAQYEDIDEIVTTELNNLKITLEE